MSRAGKGDNATPLRGDGRIGDAPSHFPSCSSVPSGLAFCHWTGWDQYLYGAGLLVAPVIAEGVDAWAFLPGRPAASALIGQPPVPDRPDRMPAASFTGLPEVPGR